MAPTQKNLPRPSTGSRSHSLSPRKRDGKQPLHIRMNLTETQMDRFTNAFVDKVSNVPVKATHSDETTTVTSPTPGVANSRQALHGTPRSLNSSYEDNLHSNSSPAFSELMPGRQTTLGSSGLAERRHQVPPHAIDVSEDGSAIHTLLQSRVKYVSTDVSPLTQSHGNSSLKLDTVSISLDPASYHRHHLQGKTPISLNNRVSDISSKYSQIDVNGSPLSSRAQVHGSVAIQMEPMINNSRRHQPQHSKITAEELRRLDSQARHHPEAGGKESKQTRPPMDSPMFSPLAVYFRSQDFPTVKKGGKIMIGRDGWLERTEKLSDQDKKAPQRKVGILDSIKKIAKDITELHHPHRRLQSVVKEPNGSQMAISLNAREQSLLYCEMEFHLANTLNDYITAELDKGHLVADSLKKIADAWYQQGRPRIVGFRYDLETQLELISLHINDFAFHGRRQGNPAEITGLLHSMKVNARAMRIRTFCQPDSVIAKQLVDAQSTFNLINASYSQQVALAEIAQFFKIIVEREQDHRDRHCEAKGVSPAK